MADTADPATVTAPDGTEQQVTLTQAEPGLWRARIPVDSIGLWRIAQGDRTAVVAVGPPNPTRVHRSALDARRPSPGRRRQQRPYRHALGADGTDIPRIVTINAGSNYGGGDWMGIRMTDASTLLGISRLPLFAGFLGLAILAGLLAVTWFREGR